MKESDRIDQYRPLIANLYRTSKEKLGFQPEASIYIVSNESNSSNPLGKTAYYSPSDHKIALYTNGRHIKDILRSLSHELVHHNQNCRGDFDGGAATVEGYAQHDDHLREMEREAYEMGNMIFRDWEDNLKSKDGVSLFTNNNKYVPPMTSDIVAGGVVEGNKMKKKLTEAHLRDIIKGVIQEMFDDDMNEESDLEQMMKDSTEQDVGADIAASTDDVAVSLEEDSGEKEKENYSKNAKADKKQIKDLEKDETYDDDHESLEEDASPINESWLPKGRNIRSNARKQTFNKLIEKWCK